MLVAILTITCIQATTIKMNNGEGSYTAKTDNKQVVLIVPVRKNGFIQVDKYPTNCGAVNILASNGKKIGSSGTNYGNTNVQVEKGTVKIQIIPMKYNCNIHYVAP